VIGEMIGEWQVDVGLDAGLGAMVKLRQRSRGLRARFAVSVN